MVKKKMIPFYVLNVLQEYSDENHYLTHAEIIQHIQNMYGLVVNRKTVASALKDLGDIGYDVSQSDNGKGAALFQRIFTESSEIKYLIDSIYSSHSISQPQADKLVSSILKTSSQYERDKFGTIYKNYDNRTLNPDIFWNISIIQEAIKQKKVIKFKYLTYDINGKLVPRKKREKPSEDKFYRISPYYLVNNFGKYYVLGSQYGYDHVVTYRVDFLSDTAISRLAAVDKNTLSSFKNFDVGMYMNNHIYMFNNPVYEHTLRIQSVDQEEREKGINTIYDWFGKKASCYIDNGFVKAKVTSGMMDIIYFVLQYSDVFVLEGPAIAKAELIRIIDKLKQYY